MGQGKTAFFSFLFNAGVTLLDIKNRVKNKRGPEKKSTIRNQNKSGTTATSKVILGIISIMFKALREHRGGHIQNIFI